MIIHIAVLRACQPPYKRFLAGQPCLAYKSGFLKVARNFELSDIKLNLRDFVYVTKRASFGILRLT